VDAFIIGHSACIDVCQKHTAQSANHIMTKMRKEKWRDIAGYEKIYQVSNFGNVKRISDSKNQYKSGLILKQYKKKNSEYLRVFIYDSFGGRKMFSVHRLVAIAFVSNPYKKPEVNHKDTVKSNNKASNLEWATRLDNMRHAYENNLILREKGERHHRSKISDRECLLIKKKIKSGRSLKSISVDAGISYNIVKDISRGKTWKHI